MNYNAAEGQLGVIKRSKQRMPNRIRITPGRVERWRGSRLHLPPLRFRTARFPGSGSKMSISDNAFPGGTGLHLPFVLSRLIDYSAQSRTLSAVASTAHPQGSSVQPELLGLHSLTDPMRATHDYRIISTLCLIYSALQS